MMKIIIDNNWKVKRLHFAINILLLFRIIFSQAQDNHLPNHLLITDELPFRMNISGDGDILIFGRVSTFTSDECYVSKHDSDGNFKWAKSLGGPNYDYFQKSIEINKNIISAGNTNSFGNSQEFYLVKFNESGDTVWTKILGGKNYDNLMDIIPDDTGFLLGGSSNSFGSPSNNDLLLVKTDSSGNPLWVKSYEAGNDETMHSLIKTAGTGYLISGNTNSAGAGMKDAFILKTDSAGNSLWLRIFGASADDDALASAYYNHNIYISGYTKSYTGFQDLWVVKLDTNGNILWNKVIDFGLNENGNKIFCRNGKIFVCGYLQSLAGSFDDIFVLSMDETGNGISAFHFPLAGQQYGNFIGESDGKLLAAGYYSDSILMTIFEMEDSLFACSSSSLIYDSVSMQILSTDTFFSVNPIPLDSIKTGSGGDNAGYGNAQVGAEICHLPPGKIQNFEPLPDTMIRILPNPNEGRFEIIVSGLREIEMDECEIFIYSVLGEKLHHRKIQSGESLIFDLDLAAGIYFLNISSGKYSVSGKNIVHNY